MPPDVSAEIAVLQVEVAHLKDGYATMSALLTKQTELLSKLSAAHDKTADALTTKIDDIISKQNRLQAGFDESEKAKADQRVETALTKQRATWLLAGVSLAMVSLFELLVYFGKTILSAVQKG